MGVEKEVDHAFPDIEPSTELVERVMPCHGDFEDILGPSVEGEPNRKVFLDGDKTM